MLQKSLVIFFWHELWENEPFDVITSCTFDGEILMGFNERERDLHLLQSSSSVERVADKVKWFFDNPSLTDKAPITKEHQKEFQASLVSMKIVDNLRSYDILKYWYFFAAMCVNIPWIVSLFLFHDKLTYRRASG